MEYLILGCASIIFFIFSFIITGIAYKKSCRLLWNSIIFLFSISLIMLTRLNFSLAQKQLIWCFVSIVFVSFIPIAFKIIKDFQRFEIFYLSGGIILLLSTLIFGKEKFGALNWVSIGPISFQPSEVVKILFVFYFASVLSKKRNIKQLIVPVFFAVVFVLILVIQRDLGGALIFFMTFMTMLYVSTGNVFLMISGFSAVGVASIFAYNIFSHIRVRISAFSDPWSDFYNKGYQILHSLFAIYTWGLFGSGLSLGIPKVIPVVESDFILSAIGEEFGIVFLIGIIIIYIFMYYRGVQVSIRAKNNFYTLLCVGITGILAFQTFLIIGGVIKFIPLTGVTLPFISYGGTSILTCTIMVGLIQQIYIMNELDLIEENPEDYILVEEDSKIIIFIIKQGTNFKNVIVKKINSIKDKKKINSKSINIEDSKIIEQEDEKNKNEDTINKEVLENEVGIIKDRSKTEVEEKIISKAETKNEVEEKAISKAETKNKVKEKTISKAEMKNEVKEKTISKAEMKNEVKEKTISKAEMKNEVKEKTISKAEMKNKVEEKTISKAETKNKIEIDKEKEPSLSKVENDAKEYEKDIHKKMIEEEIEVTNPIDDYDLDEILKNIKEVSTYNVKREFKIKNNKNKK